MLTVRDIMSEALTTLEPESTLRDAMAALSREQVTGAPVVTPDGSLVGVISVSDIVGVEADAEPPPSEERGQSGWGAWPGTMEWEEGEEPAASYFVDYWDDAGADVFVRSEETERAEWDWLDEQTVAEVMSRDVVTVSPDSAVREAAGRMIASDIHRVAVTDGGRLVGILTTVDIVGALAERGLAVDSG